jgi:hypothetical protein
METTLSVNNLCSIVYSCKNMIVSLFYKKRIIWPAVCIVFMLSACKNEQQKVTADMLNFPVSASGDTGEPRPVITFDSTDWHFGKIAIGEKLNHTFRFKNTGNSPLIISQVSASCGCTLLKDWPKDPIAPGAEGQISAEFNSAGNSGQVAKTIYVSTNAFPKDHYLKIIGEVAGIEMQEQITTKYEMERVR